MKRLTLVLLLAFVPVACADEELGTKEAEAPENVLMQDTLPENATAPADTADALTVVLNEWTVRPARDTIPAPQGPTTFRVRNNGEYPHILEVEGQGEEWMTDTIPPGGWATLETQLESGEYELYCPIESDHGEHEELGMTTRLVVR